MGQATNIERIQTFKKGIDMNFSRRRREETRLKIRKQKKEEELRTRRLGQMTFHVNASGFDVRTTHLIDESLLKLDDHNGPVEPLLEGARGIRRILTCTLSPPVKQLVEAGGVRRLVAVLMRVDSFKLQFEAAWALTNIASSSFTSAVANEAHAIEYLIALLRSPDADVREQCSWCLGNIAGDRPQYRDRVLRLGAIEPLLANIENPANDSLFKNVTWAVSSLCRGIPGPDLDFLMPIIAPLCYLATNIEDESIKTDATWALSYISEGDHSRVEAILQSDWMLPGYLVQSVASGKPALVAPALRTLGNLAAGAEHHAQAVIDAGILRLAMSLLSHPKRNIRKDMCWLLSNIASGTQDQIENLLSKVSNALVEKAIQCDWETRRHAIFAVASIFTGGSDIQVQRLVNQNGIEAMSNVLIIPGDSLLIIAALDAIDNILTVSERNGFNYPKVLDEAKGIDRIEELQQHQDDAVYKKAVYILDRFFGGDSMEEDENLAPAYAGSHYNFGIQGDASPIAKTLFSDGFAEWSDRKPAGISFGGNYSCNFKG